MPPNVKEVAAVLKNLDVAGLTVRQKYLPLTHPQEQQQHEESHRAEEEKRQAPQQEEEECETADHVADPSHPAQSYWDWESDDISSDEKKGKVIAQILEEERIRQMLSAESIEENLINQAKSNNDIITNSEAKEENYWDMPANDEEEPSVPPCLWTDNIIANLAEEAVSIKEREGTVEYIVASHVHDETHPAHAYWDEGGCHVTEEEKRESLIQTILREEKCRQILESSNIERQLLKDASARRNVSTEIPASPESDNYWEWNSPEPKIIQAPHAEDDSHPANAYWDWKTHTVCEIKEKMISDILEEEKIRVMLSAEHVEKSLLEERQEETKEAEICNQEVTAGGESYWDW
mmetsp:Transcript_434/g.546  ORF Transcript_434/g.546 Transcript_434/m.546 type:complete len:350 (-) Transcript_434:97-1146(-)|eukprot:CAMPEP_0185730952 /NCGR_PEP_ID=MMETSP1171-20130828/11489_1 /TAXON_ID=374046 /ORGANISM="Helicotheca tamensis, Strain CCMP826" /LENGTH=349 /DNA_ID=CAMNT_0028400103 /DNA_START=236 /DNA_END=1285 /DNA_ORIENTATION=-